MSAAHTPGPWNVLFRTIVSNNEDIAEVNRLPGFENHASVRAETEANARLIAAAPELVAAVQTSVCHAGLILRFLSQGKTDKAAEYAANLRFDLRAALAKAGAS
jgi:hypothetical protein